MTRRPPAQFLNFHLQMTRGPAILLESDRWLAVDKPAGWHTVELARAPRRERADEPADTPTQSGATAHAPTVEGWLRAVRPELGAVDECGLAHRLDRETSGCLLVGKTQEARHVLRERLSGRQGPPVRKLYLALVEPGLPESGEWTLHFASRHRGSARVTTSRRGEERHRGTCRWRSLGRGQPGPPHEAWRGLDLLVVELVGPGRRHQIRAGFAFLGHPLAGDRLYGKWGAPGVGAPPTVDEAVDAAPALALHAWALELDGRRVEAPCPWLERMPGA